MLDFICMGPVDLPGAHRKRQNYKMKNSCHVWDSNPHLESCSPMLYRLSYTGFDESYPAWITFIHIMYFRYQCIHVFPVSEKIEISSINPGPEILGYHCYSTDFLEFNSLRTQPFHAWLNNKFITEPDVEYVCKRHVISHISSLNEKWKRLHYPNYTFSLFSWLPKLI